MRPGGVSMRRVVRAVCCGAMGQASGRATWVASLRAWAHSVQQTSTGLPPMVTVMAVLSSGQSQAAQVFSCMIVLQVATVLVAVEKSGNRGEALSGSLANAKRIGD